MSIRCKLFAPDCIPNVFADCTETPSSWLLCAVRAASNSDCAASNVLRALNVLCRSVVFALIMLSAKFSAAILKSSARKPLMSSRTSFAN